MAFSAVHDGFNCQPLLKCSSDTLLPQDDAGIKGAGGAKKKHGGLGPFAIMSLSYILFTTTDGGVRIIVLLHAYKQGFTALALAAIFSGYELAGMIVNLLAGMAGDIQFTMR